MPTATARIEEDGGAFAPRESARSKLAFLIKGASTEYLKGEFLKQAGQLKVDMALMLSAELTARGIPPCFRGIPTTSGLWMGATEAKLILMIADLQWIVASYPGHRCEWERAQSIYDLAKLEKTAEYLLYDGRRTPGQIAQALGLTDSQQRECAWIQCLHIERWRKRLYLRLPVAASRITNAIRATDKRTVAEQDATIKTRRDLWLCAELADWKPQRTANLYAMLTGETMPRNAVANQLAKLPKVRRTDSLFSLKGPTVE